MYPVAKVSEEVNRKCPAWTKQYIFELSSPYTDLERHNTRRHRQISRYLSTICAVLKFLQNPASKVNVSATGASDSNSQHTAPPINVFAIW